MVPASSAGARLESECPGSHDLRAASGEGGKALTNFKRSLPPPGSDMAEQILRDPYNFDFLTLTEPFAERELERGLLAHLRDLLLELGRGFAFVGSQVPLVVDGRSFYIDLRFYHLRLHCYFAIELKTGDFQPEFAGKLSFYISAMMELCAHPSTALRLDCFFARAGAAQLWSMLCRI